MKLAALLVLGWCVGSAAADDPDPDAVLDEAKTLARQGKYDEALKKHLWYHENALKFDPSHTGVRLSFALADWDALGKKYPRAREAMIEVRDKGTKTLTDGKGKADLFRDVSALNRTLKERAKTVELFKAIQTKDADLAKQCYPTAEVYLVEAREYAACSDHIPDVQKAFDQIAELREVHLKMVKDGIPHLKDYAGKAFADASCRLIEILTGAGRAADADKVRARLTAVQDDEDTRAAIAAAVKRAQSKK